MPMLRVLLILPLFASFFTASALKPLDEDNDTHAAVVPVDNIPHTTDSLSIELSANFQSRHIWRGSLTCDSWNLQPTFNVSKDNFLLGAWAVYTVNNSYAEVNLYASYSLGSFTFSLLDYYCPTETVRFNRFFDLKQSTTQHTIDATLSFDGTDKLPFTLMVSTMLWGEDLDPVTADNYYSTYLEAGYSWRRTANQHFDFSAGITPFNGYYADGFNVVSLSASMHQTLKINDSFNLPIFGKLILNPYTENLFFVFGLTLQGK